MARPPGGSACSPPTWPTRKTAAAPGRRWRRGRAEILVNNAATVEPLGPTASVSTADLRLAFQVNVAAPAALTAAVLPGMLEAGWGRVVNVSRGIAANPAGMVRVGQRLQQRGLHDPVQPVEREEPRAARGSWPGEAEDRFDRLVRAIAGELS